jgi:microcompartment protein CcmK/EutM
MNFLIAIISPNSNLEESALLKGLLPAEDSIGIGLAEVTRVSRRPSSAEEITLARTMGVHRTCRGLLDSMNITIAL